jgi:hypothetical protein
MTRDEAIQYVSFQMDDARMRASAKPDDVRPNDRLVGFHQDLETVFVAVRSHIPVKRACQWAGTGLRPWSGVGRLEYKRPQLAILER